MVGMYYAYKNEDKYLVSLTTFRGKLKRETV